MVDCADPDTKFCSNTQSSLLDTLAFLEFLDAGIYVFSK